MSDKKATEHPYTSPANIVNGQLTYHKKRNEQLLIMLYYNIA